VRAGLDITQAVKRRGRGISRYIRQIVPPLSRLDLQTTLYIRGHRWFSRSLAADLAPGTPRAWMPLDGCLPARGLDLFHSFGNHLPARARVPLSFTVHDVRALDQPAGYEGRERLLRNLARAAGVLCLTEFGKDRLLHHCPELHRRCLAVVPHGVDHGAFRPVESDRSAAVAGRYGLDRPFVLQLGSWLPHKNLELSIRAFARAQLRREGFLLAFVGGGAPADYRARLECAAAADGIADLTRWVDDVPAADLPGLLGAASALLQPSRYEGFALPVLEAMAAGTPGVVADSSCLPEVSAGIWPQASPDDPGAFAAGMDRVVLDAEARGRAIEEGLRHAARFTWERSAASTLAFFREVLLLES